MKKIKRLLSKFFGYPSTFKKVHYRQEECSKTFGELYDESEAIVKYSNSAAQRFCL